MSVLCAVAIIAAITFVVGRVSAFDVEPDEAVVMEAAPSPMSLTDILHNYDPENPDGELPAEPENPDGELPAESENPDGELPAEPENPGGDLPVNPENPGGDLPVNPENPGGDLPVNPENPGGELPVNPENPGNTTSSTPETSQNPGNIFPPDAQFPTDATEAPSTMEVYNTYSFFADEEERQIFFDNISAIRRDLDLLIYAIIPIAVAALGIVAFCKWFYRTFVHCALE